MANKFDKDTIEIKGIKYTAQFNGHMAALEAMDRCYVEGGGNTVSISKLTGYVLEHVIVDPANVDPDSFDDIDDLMELIQFGRKIMEGRFPGKSDKKPEKKESTG